MRRDLLHLMEQKLADLEMLANTISSVIRGNSKPFQGTDEKKVIARVRKHFSIDKYPEFTDDYIKKAITTYFEQQSTRS
jgi:hypothetical protein